MALHKIISYLFVLSLTSCRYCRAPQRALKYKVEVWGLKLDPWLWTLMMLPDDQKWEGIRYSVSMCYVFIIRHCSNLGSTGRWRQCRCFNNYFCRDFISVALIIIWYLKSKYSFNWVSSVHRPFLVRSVLCDATCVKGCLIICGQ